MNVVGLTFGCWDLMHYGHIRYLQRCREECTQLYVGVESDALIHSKKGSSRPIIPARERLATIASLKCVHAAFIYRTDEELNQIIQDFAVNKVFKNNKDFKLKPIINSHGTSAELVIIPDIEGLPNTKALITRIILLAGE